MDKGYELYCLADEVFYDAPPVTRKTDFDIATAPFRTAGSRSSATNGSFTSRPSSALRRRAGKSM